MICPNYGSQVLNVNLGGQLPFFMDIQPHKTRIIPRKRDGTVLVMVITNWYILGLTGFSYNLSMHTCQSLQVMKMRTAKLLISVE